MSEQEQPAPAFGATVTVSAVLRRRTRHRTHLNDEKYWDAWSIKPRTALYIGTRTLSNGERWWEDEVGNVYEPKTYFRAALVVFSAKEKPVFVPFASLEAQP
jgi:hypothetical protein